MKKLCFKIYCISAICLFLLSTPSAYASQPDQIQSILNRLDSLEKENTSLKETVNVLKKQLQGYKETAAKPVSTSSKEKGQIALDEAVAALPQETTSSLQSDKELLSIDLGPKTKLRLLDISLDTLLTVGASSEEDDELEVLQGGNHDPRRRGFTFQQAELSFLGAVDPYFLAEAHIIASEDNIELEEAFIQTTSLPASLELEAGYFLTEFGRMNPTHPHAWTWLDQPVINTRLFGSEGMRSAGARVSKLLNTPWYSAFHLGAQNADGERMPSFLGGEIAHQHGHEEEEGDGHDHELGIGGRPIDDQSVQNLGDLVYLARWENSFDISETWTTKIGLSGLYGPNFTGSDGETWIYGTDFFFKWVPKMNERGRPFFRLSGEVMVRDLEADEFYEEEEDELISGDTLTDWGLYLEGLYGFKGRWSAGLRYEYASGSGSNLEHEGAYPSRDNDPFRDDRTRISPLLVYSPSEFSRIRLQYNYDEADHLDDEAHSVWLGLEALIGAHPAHSY